MAAGQETRAGHGIGPGQRIETWQGIEAGIACLDRVPPEVGMTPVPRVPSAAGMTPIPRVPSAAGMTPIPRVAGLAGVALGRSVPWPARVLASRAILSAVDHILTVAARSARVTRLVGPGWRHGSGWGHDPGSGRSGIACIGAAVIAGAGLVFRAAGIAAVARPVAGRIGVGHILLVPNVPRALRLQRVPVRRTLTCAGGACRVAGLAPARIGSVALPVKVREAGMLGPVACRAGARLLRRVRAPGVELTLAVGVSGAGVFRVHEVRAA